MILNITSPDATTQVDCQDRLKDDVCANDPDYHVIITRLVNIFIPENE